MKTCLTALSIVLFAHPAAFAQEVRVLVLDAKSGRPQANIQVEYFCSDSRRNYFPIEEEDTDSAGIAIVPYRCKGEDAQIAISASGSIKERHAKEQCGDGEVVACYERISSQGILSAPDVAGQMQCTTKVSRKLKPVPGLVIIFVKRPSWWQEHF